MPPPIPLSGADSWKVGGSQSSAASSSAKCGRMSSHDSCGSSPRPSTARVSRRNARTRCESATRSSSSNTTLSYRAVVRTYVRVCNDPACGPRRLLLAGRAACGPEPARPARHRGDGRRPGGELRGPRARDPLRDGRTARAPALPGCRPRPGPNDVVLPPRMSEDAEASKAVYRVFEDTAPLVEGLSIDEAFLDMRGMQRMAGTPLEIAARLRRRVLADVGLPLTVGIARTKFLAKVASGVAKPDGLLEVPPAGELDFLHPLPVEAVWGVGRKTAEKLHARGITTVAQVAALAETTLVEMIGRAAGRQLHALSHNRDPRRVTTGRRRRSIGSQNAIGRRKRTPAELDAFLVAIVDRISRRLRAARRVCRTVTLRLRFDDYTRVTRSHTFVESTQRTDVVLMVARG